MKKLIGIYQILNTVTNKRYIGLSKNIKRRLGSHKNALLSNRHENSYLQHAWNKYGESSFTFELIEIVEFENLNSRETYWIRFYKSNVREFGYNCNEGGDSRKLSEETKIKIGNANKGKKRSKEMIDEFKKRIRQPLTNEQRKKISDSHKGVKHSEERKESISKGRMGKYAGENSSSAKIVEAQAVEIFKRINTGQKRSTISREMSISLRIIDHIKYGETWNHITNIPKKLKN